MLNKCGCGGEKRVGSYSSELSRTGCFYSVRCTACGIETVEYDTEQKAIEASNKAHPKAIRLEDVRKMIEECVRVGQTCDKCDNKHGNLCRALWAVIDGDNIDKLTAYVEGKNESN